MKRQLGRHVFGLAILAFGLVTFAWPGSYDWLRLASIWGARGESIFADVASVAQIAGGIALQFRRSASSGALVVAALYAVFAATCVPRIVIAPQIYDRWGNFFEQFSLAIGAALVYAGSVRAWSPRTIARTGRTLFGTCVVSFTLEQAIYLDATAKLVPPWLPPSQSFWAIATTVPFALAAIALLANRSALLASRLLTAMLVTFGLLVWIPQLLSAPHDGSNWSETAETFAIAGAAWILADLIAD